MAAKEERARMILELVRSGTHPYIQLRHHRKKLRFFCNLCLQQCYGDDDLVAHLDGKPHKQRKTAAQFSPLRPKPWPFDDCVTFFDFDASSESDESVESNDEPCSTGFAVEGETCEGRVREIGCGKIAARFIENSNMLIGIRRIWCEWLGKENDDAVEVQEHDFAVVVFSCGKGSMTERENDTSLLTNKAARKELRCKELQAAERLCRICFQTMHPGKDVATLLNLKNRRLVCTKTNTNGDLHFFHTSCLVHWIIMCEHVMITNRLVSPNVRPKEIIDIKTLFCPTCQGTGMTMSTGDGVMNPKFYLAQMFELEIKVFGARREWFKSPEVSQKCSIGLHFPSQPEEIFEDKVQPIKLLRFYRAGDPSGA